jgi:hypothetical protein
MVENSPLNSNVIWEIDDEIAFYTALCGATAVAALPLLRRSQPPAT